MIVRTLELRCSAVVADAHVYLAATDLGLLATDLAPVSVELKRRMISKPGAERPVCEVVALEDGRHGTEVSFRLMWRSASRDALVRRLADQVDRRAGHAAHRRRPIGFHV